MLLVGDIGGTHTRLELFDSDYSSAICSSTLFSKNFDSLDTAIVNFFEPIEYSLKQVTHAVFAVAGPVKQNKVFFTNLPWQVSKIKLQTLLHTQHVELINDFVASAYGVKQLHNNEYVILQKAEPINNTHRVILGAGTGFGVGLVYCSQTQYFVCATEGGHADFSPINEEQVGLFYYLKNKWKRVSIERILSGDGLINLYHYLQTSHYSKNTEHPLIKNSKKNNTLTAEIISQLALTNTDALAHRTILLFIELYAQTIGNIALTTMPHNGLFITGGIAPKLLPFFKSNSFLSAIMNKGRMSDILKSIPIYLVTNTHIGLKGAVNYAQQTWQPVRTQKLFL